MFYASFYLVLNLFYLFLHQTMICNKPHKYPSNGKYLNPIPVICLLYILETSCKHTSPSSCVQST